MQILNNHYNSNRYSRIAIGKRVAAQFFKRISANEKYGTFTQSPRSVAT